MTHYYGDLCPGGHGAAPTTRVGLDDQLTPRGADGQAERVRTAIETLTAAAGENVAPDCPECAELGHTSCYEAGRRAGREDAAWEIRAHADQFAPAGGNVHQQRLRRHLLIGARVAAPELTMQEVADAVMRGDYAACHLDVAGRSVEPEGQQ